MMLADKARAVLGHPRSRLLAALVLGIVLGRLSVTSPEGGDAQKVDSTAASGAMVSCQDRARALEKDRRQLQEELAYLKQSVVVEQEACFGLRESLFEKEGQISKLTEQLAFYRGVVTPDGQDDDLRLYRFDLESVAQRDYQFRAILLQSVSQRKQAEGRLELALVGLNPQGESRRFDLQELSRGDFSGDFSFRYYTEMYGQFRLPEPWAPLRIEARVMLADRREPAVSRIYPWKELITAQDAEEGKDD